MFFAEPKKRKDVNFADHVLDQKNNYLQGIYSQMPEKLPELSAEEMEAIEQKYRPKVDEEEGKEVKNSVTS